MLCSWHRNRANILEEASARKHVTELEVPHEEIYQSWVMRENIHFKHCLCPFMFVVSSDLFGTCRSVRFNAMMASEVFSAGQKILRKEHFL